MTGIRIEHARWDGEDATTLRAHMDADVGPRYADLFRTKPHPATPVDVADIVFTLVAYDGAVPVGTASLKRTGAYFEVKRVFVEPRARRIGLAARLLEALEVEAATRGVRDLVLQTGSRQPEASALYEREGWRAIAPFGPYEGDEEISRCYAKAIAPLVVGVQIGAGSVPQVVDTLVALDDAGVDVAVLDDRYLHEARALGVDAPILASFAARRTRRLALAPTIATAHTEPFHLAKAVQTLDFVSEGRAGWNVRVEDDEAEAALFGRRPAASAADLWAEADEVIDVAQRLWDSWEDDAVIRDVATGRFIDRERVHHIDFSGEYFSVKGPSIVPRSPQGLPPVIVRVPDGDARALDVAARRADVVRVGAGDVTAAREALSAAGRTAHVLVDVTDPGDVRERTTRILTVRTTTGADGVVLAFASLPDDPAGLATSLRGLGSGRHGSFRALLGLERPASRYARQEVRA